MRDPTAPPGAGAVLTIDLDAIAANYATLCAAAPGAEIASVVKADAYGLCAARVAPALWRAGCRTFFVALPDEGVALRQWLPPEAVIAVLSGPMADSAELFIENHLRPVVNDLIQLEYWSSVARAGGPVPPAILHVDTGMNRLGFGPRELERLLADPERLAGLSVALVMSHLARAEESAAPMNADQLRAFHAALARLAPHIGGARASLANSAGVFLGPEYHLDMVRPGVALYGVNAHGAQPSPYRQVVHLHGKILQVHDVDSPTTVGYGATHRVSGAARVATVAVGYADGYLRSLSSRGHAHVANTSVPVVGRISMDLITLDVSAVPPVHAQPGAMVELIGDHVPVDSVAEAAGTIGYEILTALGCRYHRVYRGGGA